MRFVGLKAREKQFVHIPAIKLELQVFKQFAEPSNSNIKTNDLYNNPIGKQP